MHLPLLVPRGTLRQLGGTYQSEVVRRAEIDEARLPITVDEWAVDTGPAEGSQLK
jgi:hypothetical protein